MLWILGIWLALSCAALLAIVAAASGGLPQPGEAAHPRPVYTRSPRKLKKLANKLSERLTAVGEAFGIL